MGVSRQEYWCRLPCPPPGYLRRLGTILRSPTLQVDSLPSEPPGLYSKSWLLIYFVYSCMYLLIPYSYFMTMFSDALKTLGETAPPRALISGGEKGITTQQTKQSRAIPQISPLSSLTTLTGWTTVHLPWSSQNQIPDHWVQPLCTRASWNYAN